MSLRNIYYVLRHGHSLANQQKIIISDIEHGRDAYGLSPWGIAQVVRTLENWPFPKPDMIFHSDFKRTVETAALASDHISVPASPSPALRERYFGDFEQLDDSQYELVWQHDIQDPEHEFGEVESLQSVCDRQMDFLQDLEQQYEGKHILLVGHGDPLQILLTHFLDKPLNQHRDLVQLDTAEARRLAPESD
ncbi:histidine phosphatase family protein [Budvicia diplopodorum]|uniref:histidine phosphatase family protein n=1 Tax=Budvicia diplopodorum TaxID=1119056 RepID=UPI00135870C8|nr:histidine phosphatase family protein [Budvicia diplopodorum]